MGSTWIIWVHCHRDEPIIIHKHGFQLRKNMGSTWIIRIRCHGHKSNQPIKMKHLIWVQHGLYGFVAMDTNETNQ